MTVIYYHWCDDCGKHSRDAIEQCEYCGSRDITYAAAFSHIEINDESAEKRLAEIRGNTDPETGCAFQTGFMTKRQAS